MLTRRQLLGGLVACVPLIGMAKAKTKPLEKSVDQMMLEAINNHDFSSHKNRWLVLIKGNEYFVTCVDHYKAHQEFNASVISPTENFRINVDDIIFNADNSMTITKWYNNRKKYVRILNIKPDEFGIPVGPIENNENFLKMKEFIC